MPSHRKTGRGLMNSAFAKAGKANRKGVHTGTSIRVRQMDLASRREEWLADQKRQILQARKKETGDVTAGNPSQEGNDDFDVESYLYREAVLLSA
ncbi:hypothetical protein FRC00_004283 [Tulasnella sp. 408]|nr:hypothetical protein FRC00_004283 [Tulasnella sp. 408]